MCTTPHIDGLALLKGERIFTLQLRNKYVIGKIEKGFDFKSTSISRKIRIQSSVLIKYTSRLLLAELIRLGYASGQTMEFVGVSKRLTEQDSIEITLVTEDTKTLLLRSFLFLEGEHVTVSLPATIQSPNFTADALTTTLLIKGLPIQQSQIQVIAVVHRLLGARNVVLVTFNCTQDDTLGRHDGIATVRCLNSAIYTHKVNRRAIPLLNKLVDFVPYCKSLAGSTPSTAVQLHDQRPAREALADAITAIQNNSRPASTFDEFQQTMRGVEERIDACLAILGAGINTYTSLSTETLGTDINVHTTRTADVTSITLATQQAYLIEQLHLLTDASEEYNKRMISISSALRLNPSATASGPPPPPKFSGPLQLMPYAHLCKYLTLPTLVWLTASFVRLASFFNKIVKISRTHQALALLHSEIPPAHPPTPFFSSQSFILLHHTPRVVIPGVRRPFGGRTGRAGGQPCPLRLT
jgi:hypothetical protein